jgi:hypothetical protein
MVDAVEVKLVLIRVRGVLFYKFNPFDIHIDQGVGPGIIEMEGDQFLVNQ